jgi:hypothetical protein
MHNIKQLGEIHMSRNYMAQLGVHVQVRFENYHTFANSIMWFIFNLKQYATSPAYK